MALTGTPAKIQKIQDDSDNIIQEIRSKLSPKRVVRQGKIDVLDKTFPEQRSFIQDPSSFKFAICTRRAAKSYSFGLECIDDSEDYPRANYLFIGRTKPEAKRIFWKDVLKDIAHNYPQLELKFNEAELTCTTRSGATIYVTAADANQKEKEKLLGGKYRKAAIDEAQSWGTDLEQLVMSVLKPAMADMRGSISLLGTPGNLIHGFFKRVTNGCSAAALGPSSIREPGWSGHTWSTDRNPYMAKQWALEIKELIEANPRVVETPWFKQQYRGEWVVDLESLCYKFNLEGRNSWDGKLPDMRAWHLREGRWHYVLGIDLGYSPDPSAWVVGCYHDYEPKLFLLESWKQWKMDITDVANRTRLYQESYSFDAVVIDGSNKQAVEEMRRRHNLDLIPADKKEKSDFIELMSDDYIQGRIVVNLGKCNQGLQNRVLHGKNEVHESLALEDEYAGLIWDPKKLLEDQKRVEHPGCPNHLCDAALYLWRHCYQYLSVRPAAPPDVGTPAWHQQQEDQMWDREMDALNERRVNEAVGLPETTEWDPNLMP